MKKIKDRIIRMGIMGLKQLQDPYYHGFAAQISFFLMLSIIPTFILIFQCLGVFGISIETAIDTISQYTGKRISAMVMSIFEYRTLGVRNIFFIILAIWAGSRASFALIRIANYTLTEGDNTGRNFFIERARAMKTMLTTIITVVFTIVILCYGEIIFHGIVAFIMVFHPNLDQSITDTFWMWLRWPLAFALYVMTISYNFYILPTEKIPFKTVLPGAIFASFGMIAISWGYSLYSTSLTRYDLIYGALSSVVAILIWFYLLAWVLTLGVLFNKVWSSTSAPFSKRNPPEHLKRIQRSKFDIDPDDFKLIDIAKIIAGLDKKE